MRIVAIVQQRMGSTRLPGKAAMLIQGKSLTWHVLNRVRQAQLIDDVVLALPDEPVDSTPLAQAAHDLGIHTFSIPGNPCDLLKRHTLVARACKADLIVRVPGDNPCVDPDEIDRIVRIAMFGITPMHTLVSNLDRNINGNGYPGGLGAEVYTLEFLEWLERNQKCAEYREHPHVWAFANGRVKTIQCPEAIRRPDLRFDVNEQKDFDFITGIYNALYRTNPNFRTKDILNYLEGAKGQWQITHETWANKSQAVSPA